MSQQRLFLIHAALILLIFGHLYDIVQDREHWPFSKYEMFSRAQTERSLTRMELYGVMQEDSHQEFPLRQVGGFGGVRETQSLRYISYSQKIKPKERPQMLNDALLDALSKYESERLAGEHDGPPLQGTRLYEATWQLDSPTKSIADPPDQKKLIYEVLQP
jgi:hypothetical protein